MRLFMLPQPAGTKAITSQFTERLNAITASDWLDTRRLSLDGEAWWRYEGASYLLPRIPARTGGVRCGDVVLPIHGWRLNRPRERILIAGSLPEKEKSPPVARRGGTKLLDFDNVHPRIQGRRRHGDGDIGVV